MKRLLLSLLTFSTVIMLAGCGSRATGEGSTANSAADTANTSGNAEDSEAVPDGENSSSDSAVSDRMLQIGIGSEFSNIVPMSNNVALANRDGLMIFALYDPLLWFDTEAAELKPWICTEWETSEDGLEYILTIRDDVTFHNGTKMTVNDVVFTLNLIPENPVVTDANIPGFDYAEVIDDTHCRIVMEQPFAAVPNFLASYHLLVLSEEYYNEVGWEGYEEHPIGTGPYKFEDRVIGGSMTLSANEAYWNGAPDIKNVRINILPDSSAQVLSLETGEIDVLQDSSLQSCANIEKEEGLNVSYSDSFKVCFMGWGAKSTLDTDENLRKAVACAIDYDSINNVLNFGHTKSVSCLLAPGITDRPEDGTFTAPFGYDTEAAKTYLAASEYDGRAFNIICTQGSKEENLCKIIQGNLLDIGINAELAAVDGATFMTYQSEGDYDINVYSTLPSLYDANLVYQNFMRGVSMFENSNFEYKEELADLGLATLVEMDHAKRQELFAQMFNIINEHARFLFLYQDCNTMAFNDDVAGCRAIPGTNYRIADWSWAD